MLSAKATCLLVVLDNLGGFSYESVKREPV